MAFFLCWVTFVPPELRFVWFRVGRVWNQFSNLHPDWVELENPKQILWHQILSSHAAWHSFLFIGHVPMRGIHDLFYKMWCDAHIFLLCLLGTQWAKVSVLHEKVDIKPTHVTWHRQVRWHGVLHFRLGNTGLVFALSLLRLELAADNKLLELVTLHGHYMCGRAAGQAAEMWLGEILPCFG